SKLPIQLGREALDRVGPPKRAESPDGFTRDLIRCADNDAWSIIARAFRVPSSMISSGRNRAFSFLPDRAARSGRNRGTGPGARSAQNQARGLARGSSVLYNRAV